MSIDFTEWPKTPRLFRDMIVTEKIDGTNSAVGIKPISEVDRVTAWNEEVVTFFGPDQDNIL